MTAAQAKWGRTMDDSIIRENIKHYLALLERTSDENERARISALLAEERRKEKKREGVGQQFVRDLGASVSRKARSGQNTVAPPGD